MCRRGNTVSVIFEGEKKQKSRRRRSGREGGGERNVTMKRCPTMMKCREFPHSVYYISPLMTEHMLSVYLCHVLAK